MVTSFGESWVALLLKMIVPNANVELAKRILVWLAMEGNNFRICEIKEKSKE